MRQLATLVMQGAPEVHAAIPSLGNRKQLEKMRSHIIEINRIELVIEGWTKPLTFIVLSPLIGMAIGAHSC